MAVALVADAHLGGRGGSGELLIEQLRSLDRGSCERLVFLGDLFHVWVGARCYETPEIEAVVEVLRELRGKGLALDYIEGNRDFFLADSEYADAFDRVVDEVAFEIAGRHYLVIHGDGLNDRDRRYRWWRFLSKNALSRTFSRRLPRGFARWLVQGTEKRLARTNFKHKAEIPAEVIRRYAVQRLAEGHDVLLLGHFHEARTWSVDGGEVRILEAWYNDRRIQWIGDRARGGP